MSDITILRSGETMVAQAEGQTEAAVEFIDSYFPPRTDAEMHVVDSGRVILSTEDVDDFCAEAKRGGFTVEVTDGV